MTNDERIRLVRESTPVIAAILTNAIYTAELMYAQKGIKRSRAEITKEVVASQNELTTALLGE